MKIAMSNLAQRNKLKIKGEAICPKCGSLGIYEYVLEGPIKNPSQNFSSAIKIHYSFKCMTCDYHEDKKLIVPLHGLYPLRHLLNSEAKVFLERIYLLSKDR